MVYVRVVVFTQQPSWGISFRTSISLCLKIVFLSVLRLYGHQPSPRGRVPVNAYALSLPLCPISGARALHAEAGIGGRESLFHPSLYNVEAVLHLRFSSFCKK